MVKVDTFSNDAFQLTKIVLADASVLVLNLKYNPALQRWRMDIFHPNITINGINLCLHPNFLRTWRRVIGFGIACTATDGVDPIYIDDFVNGRVSVFILDASEVEDIEKDLLTAA